MRSRMREVFRNIKTVVVKSTFAPLWLILFLLLGIFLILSYMLYKLMAKNFGADILDNITNFDIIDEDSIDLF